VSLRRPVVLGGNLGEQGVDLGPGARVVRNVIEHLAERQPACIVTDERSGGVSSGA